MVNKKNVGEWRMRTSSGVITFVLATTVSFLSNKSAASVVLLSSLQFTDRVMNLYAIFNSQLIRLLYGLWSRELLSFRIHSPTSINSCQQSSKSPINSLANICCDNIVRAVLATCKYLCVTQY